MQGMRLARHHSVSTYIMTIALLYARPLRHISNLLYLWGEEKNTMFHTAEAVALLNSTKGCLAAPVSGAAHFLHRQQPDAVWARVCPFVLGGAAR